MAAEVAGPPEISMDPLRGEVFYLSAYMPTVGSDHRPKVSYGGQSTMDYTISSMFSLFRCFVSMYSVSKILVGPPPDNTLSEQPHTRESIVIISGLQSSTTDAQIKRDCIESIGRPRFIYMHVGDARTGLFSGTCVVAFWEKDSAIKASQIGILSKRVRPVSQEEFDSLSKGDWPMLEYGPARGVFSSKSISVPSPAPQAPPAPSWVNRPPVANPWQ